MKVVPVSIPEGKLEQAFAVAFAPVVALSELIKNASDSCYIKNDTIKVFIETNKQQIRIVDKGYGFSASDILQLGTVTTSLKMSSSNKRSRIGEPYAGSKGQGIFTAFNLCTDLEIRTFSRADNKSYRLTWKDGTAQITYEEVSEEFEGTELILKGVSDESFKMITRYGEPQKLISSTILYYQDSETLPNIELYLNDNQLPSEVDRKIESLYNKHSTKKAGSTGFFIAKAKFSYNNHTLKISYEDNESGIFIFEDITLDISNNTALKKFVRDKGITLEKSQEVYKGLEEFSEVELDSFSGNLYIWFNKTIPELNYQYGVRVYINNYGLYNFLNKDNDWLGLTQISQNRKATSYKLKNAFGFVHFDEFDESFSSLKISSDRNSFLGNLASKKFEFLMKNVIINIFASLDIEMRRRKQNPEIIFEDKDSTPKLYVDEAFSFKNLIKVSQHLSLYNVDVECESDLVNINKESGEITVSDTGQYKINFTYGDQVVDKEFYVDRRIPDFELVKRLPKIVHGTDYPLRKLIKKSSLKNLSKEEITITSDDAIIQKGLILSPENNPGDYKIEFKASKYEIDLARDIVVPIEQVNTKEAQRLKKKFLTSDKYSKINDAIKGIAESYYDNPTFASISIRPLVEISLKAFIYEFYSNDEIEKIEQNSKRFNPISRIDSLVDKLKGNAINTDERILSVEGKSVQKSRNKIKNAYEGIEPNDNVHALQSAATGKHVFDTMSVLSILINFIIKAINEKYKHD